MAITGCTLTGTISDTPDRPQVSDGTYLRSFDSHEANAGDSLLGVVSNEGPYQDMTVILTAVANAYASLWTTATQQQLSPRSILMLMRDTLLFMLNNRGSMVRSNAS